MQSCFQKEDEDRKFNIQLLEVLSDKIIQCNPNIVKTPKWTRLTDIFGELFKKEEKEQDYEEITKNMRSYM